jgi:hypothetical protein
MERGLLSDILPAINFSDVIELVDGLLLKLGSQAMMVAGLKCPYGHIMAHPNRYQNGPFMQLPQEEKEKKRKKLTPQSTPFPQHKCAQQPEWVVMGHDPNASFTIQLRPFIFKFKIE